jgi:hypothetical protein
VTIRGAQPDPESPFKRTPPAQVAVDVSRPIAIDVQIATRVAVDVQRPPPESPLDVQIATRAAVNGKDGPRKSTSTRKRPLPESMSTCDRSGSRRQRAKTVPPDRCQRATAPEAAVHCKDGPPELAVNA